MESTRNNEEKNKYNSHFSIVEPILEKNGVRQIIRAVAVDFTLKKGTNLAKIFLPSPGT